MREQGKPKSRLSETIKKIGTSLLKLFGGDFPVFVLFLGITLFLWWSQTMSQSYEMVMKVPVRVTGVPDNVRMTSQYSSQLSVTLSGKGSSLRKSQRKGAHREIRVSNSAFSMSQGHAALSTVRLRDSITAMLPPSVLVRSIEPDSLVYHYALQRSVMLPVEFDGTTESRDQFFLERVEFKPDSIRAHVLLSDTLSHRIVADVASVVLQADTLIQDVAVKPVPGIILDTENVRMTVLAQQYTEKTIEVPVRGVNFPEHLSLKSFPSRVTVIAWVKMSEYDRVGPADFQVVVDYNDIAGRDVSTAPLRIFSQPANVRNVRLQTRSVDFLMESKLF